MRVIYQLYEQQDVQSYSRVTTSGWQCIPHTNKALRRLQTGVDNIRTCNDDQTRDVLSGNINAIHPIALTD